MLFYLRNILLLILLLSLTGCGLIYGEKGIIRNRTNDYQRAQSITPLRIPPGLSSSTITAHYPVSERAYTNNTPVDLTPPELHPSRRLYP